MKGLLIALLIAAAAVHPAREIKVIVEPVRTEEVA